VSINRTGAKRRIENSSSTSLRTAGDRPATAR
jgi:hypothetical protein